MNARVYLKRNEDPPRYVPRQVQRQLEMVSCLVMSRKLTGVRGFVKA